MKEKSLKEKIEEIEAQMPGMRQMLEMRNLCKSERGCIITENAFDLAYAETEDYQVAAELHRGNVHIISYKEPSEFRQRLLLLHDRFAANLFYRRKGSTEPLKVHTAKSFYDLYGDSEAPYYQIAVKHVKGNTLEVTLDLESKHFLTFKVDLDEVDKELSKE